MKQKLSEGMQKYLQHMGQFVGIVAEEYASNLAYRDKDGETLTAAEVQALAEITMASIQLIQTGYCS